MSCCQEPVSVGHTSVHPSQLPISVSVTAHQSPVIRLSSCQGPGLPSFHPSQVHVSVSLTAQQSPVIHVSGCPTQVSTTLSGSSSGGNRYANVVPGPPQVTQQNVNPFYLKILTGNSRICQGCRGSLRLPDSRIPSPPYDMIIARLEKRSFWDHSGTLKTPSRASAAHYHAFLVCVRVLRVALKHQGG